MNKNTKRKDWVGGSAAVFKTLGASNHTCAEQMQKHQPFGWLKNQGLYRNIANVMSYSITFADNEARDVNYEQAFKNYTFADGTPFGVKVEK